MIDQSAASNITFKARVFVFIWVLLTGAAWLILDSYLDETLKEFYIFLQASAASYMPVQLFGNKALVVINGQSFKAAELATYLSELEIVQKMINLFLVVVPAATIAMTGLIFFFVKKNKGEEIKASSTLTKYSGD